MAVCSVVKAELFYGAMRSNNPTRTLERQQDFLDRFVSLSFGDEAALLFGQIRASLASAGTPIGAYDLQIAAIGSIINQIKFIHFDICDYEKALENGKQNDRKSGNIVNWSFFLQNATLCVCKLNFVMTLS